MVNIAIDALLSLAKKENESNHDTRAGSNLAGVVNNTMQIMMQHKNYHRSDDLSIRYNHKHVPKKVKNLQHAAAPSRRIGTIKAKSFPNSVSVFD